MNSTKNILLWLNLALCYLNRDVTEFLEASKISKNEDLRPPSMPIMHPIETVKALAPQLREKLSRGTARAVLKQ